MGLHTPHSTHILYTHHTPTPHTHLHTLHTHSTHTLYTLHTHTTHTTHYTYHTLHTHTLHTLYTVHPPSDSSELFATSSRGDVRVWHTGTGKELLRLAVPNLTCHALDITPDGGAILTGTHTHTALASLYTPPSSSSSSL